MIRVFSQTGVFTELLACVEMLNRLKMCRIIERKISKIRDLKETSMNYLAVVAIVSRVKRLGYYEFLERYFSVEEVEAFRVVTERYGPEIIGKTCFLVERLS